ncbi:Tc toxin subunit A-related protein [Desulfonatronum parangueonense]
MRYPLATQHQFHGLLDTELFFWPGHVRETIRPKYFVIQERKLNYRFYLHQHPYLQQLLQRLVRAGTPGLQAADTEFHTRIRLRGPAEAQGSNGRKVQLEYNEVLFLSDGQSVNLNDSDTLIRFSGSKVLDVSDGSALTPPAESQVTLKTGTTLRRSTGEKVTLDSPLTCKLLDGVPVPVLYEQFFAALYRPDADMVPDTKESPHPVKDLDFTPSGAYAAYNWELFYHVPVTIAIHLSKNQRFAEAQRWFHFLFDPTDDSHGPTPERFWKVRPFQYTDVQQMEELLTNLVTGKNEKLRNETIRSIEAWKDAPFRPHVIARYRQQAYMYKTVMAYLDNLIAWGDSLFRQDTGEAIDEALQLYVLAANILGPRPLPVPRKGSVRPQTFANLRQDLSQFGTVMRDMEADLPFNLTPFPMKVEGDDGRMATLRSLGKALYFCVPPNDKLLSYWDTVADRLFKIRNSLNIQGVFRQLALFEPPIDPAMLARATAAGLDVGAIINGLNQPLPLVRFQLLVQKAAEIVQEVKSLGNNLLSAMEKEDGEAMAILRAKHERVALEMVEHVRYGQLQEAIKSKEGLLQSLALAVQRYSYYELQLGRKADEIEKAIPELGELDQESLDKMKFAMDEPEMMPRKIEVDIAEGVVAKATRCFSGGKLLSSHEVRESLLLESAQLSSDTANVMNFMGSLSYIFPNLKIQGQPMGVGGTVEWGGQNLGDSLHAIGAAARALADRLNFEARRASRVDGYTRRELDWAFQSNLAAGEINQIFKQLRAAQIREAIADLELKNHRQQMKHANEIERFLNEEGTERTGKKTNKALYAWMKREVKGLYSQCFQFAFDIAKKAERALQHELGNTELNYVKFGYLAGKEGLLAGEKLYLDVKRMEMAYFDLNQREYEMTKHVSLLQVDPLALIQLRATGRCAIKLPEALFDMDGPGHYFRRIKTVAVSIPCVAGPYAGINCTLTLLRSSIRKTQILRDGVVYAREDAEDKRFSDYFGSLQSIVTSSAQNDSGLFETNLRDERYLPFENSGVISEWQLQLPANPSKEEPAQFDYNTISDVILHVRYTAREGGELLRNAAIANLIKAIDSAEAAGSVRLYSVRHEFPTEWAKFTTQTPSTDGRYELKLNLRPEHYPFWSQGRLGSVKRLSLFARVANDIDVTINENIKVTLKQNSLGKLRAAEMKVDLAPVGKLSLHFSSSVVEDLWLAVSGMHE